MKPEVKVYYLIFSLCLCLHFVLFQTLSLKWPYESNCSETPIFSIPGYNKYTTSTCTLICKSKYLVDKCGCRDPRLLGKCYLKFVCQSLIFSTTFKVCHQGEFFKWKKTLSRKRKNGTPLWEEIFPVSRRATRYKARAMPIVSDT